VSGIYKNDEKCALPILLLLRNGGLVLVNNNKLRIVRVKSIMRTLDFLSYVDVRNGEASWSFVLVISYLVLVPVAAVLYWYSLYLHVTS
jgi:hypothetical protein